MHHVLAGRRARHSTRIVSRRELSKARDPRGEHSTESGCLSVHTHLLTVHAGRGAGFGRSSPRIPSIESRTRRCSFVPTPAQSAPLCDFLDAPASTPPDLRTKPPTLHEELSVTRSCVPAPACRRPAPSCKSIPTLPDSTLATAAMQTRCPPLHQRTSSASGLFRGRKQVRRRATVQAKREQDPHPRWRRRHLLEPGQASHRRLRGLVEASAREREARSQRGGRRWPSAHRHERQATLQGSCHRQRAPASLPAMSLMAGRPL